ncbi:MAG: hypothetical protein V4665_04400 [Patescibacteria group bacterium]
MNTPVERIDVFRADLETFGERVASFAQMFSIVEDTLLMDEMPESYQDTPITDKQKKLLVDLIHQRFSNKNEKERWLREIEGMSKFDASEAISSLLMGGR